MKPSVYIESSVVSYYAARPSRDLVVACHQQLTHEWWASARSRYDCYVSPVVIEEISAGDAAAAERRLAAVAALPVLGVTSKANELAAEYLERLQIPDESQADAFHLALASWHGMHYLVTWNCRHIANARVRFVLVEVNSARGIRTPIVCSPEELLEA